MTILFTQYLQPFSIDMPEEIELLAQKFIEAGGWYEAEVLPDGAVSLTACAVVDEEPDDIECVLATNGPGMKTAVEKLVRASAKRIGSLDAIAGGE